MPVPTTDPEQPRRVALLLDRGALRHWHVETARRLAGLPGISREVRLVDGSGRLPARAGLLFDLERLIYGTPPARASRPAAPADFELHTAAPDADLVIDLSGTDAPASTAARWTLRFDGGTGEAALLTALLENRLPLAELRDGDRTVASGRLGTEYQGIAAASMEDCLCRCVTLIEGAVKAWRTGRTAALPAAGPREHAHSLPGGSDAARLAAKKLARALVSRMYRLCFFSPQWRLGWRTVGPEGDLFDLRRHPAGGWRTIADDGKRFYADPFPIEREGRTFLFVEEFEHRVGKGIICAAEFGPEGLAGPLLPVLETAEHLSYPFVFEHEGEAWMIPESSAGDRIDLFRATAFPGGWVREATLVSGVTASDATLIRRDGRWWMLATVRDGGGCFSDALYIWSARDLHGPYEPHPANPVLIDVTAARPAGRMVERGGTIYRPVQDCRARYGGALAIARIDRLDGEGFAQTVETVIQAGGPEWPGRRIHSLNRAGPYEFIDGSGKPPRRFF